MRVRRAYLVTLALVGGGALLVSGSPAVASDVQGEVVTPEEAASTIDRIDSVSPGLLLDTVETSVTEGGFTHENSEGVAVTVSQDPSAGVQLDSAAGEVVGVTIPQADDVDGGVRDEKGLIHFADTPGFTTTVLPTDGGSQLLTSIADSSAPERFTYDLSLPEGAIVTRDEASGGVIAETPAGELLLLVAPPWAVDATGQQIDTTFEVTENSITQIVAHRDANTTYPVLADPTINGTLIKSYQWRNYQGSGRQISVHVTPAMGWATIAAAQGGWTELAKAVQSRSASEYRLLNTDSMKQQWNCHAYGKGLIWLNTVLGRDDRPSWDLETIRKPLRGNIVEGLKKMTAHQCNW